MSNSKNLITAAIWNKFGWSTSVYAKRKGIAKADLINLIYGKSYGKYGKAKEIKQMLIKDRVWHEVTRG